MPSSAYFDSCLFIELLQKGNPGRFGDCEDLWQKAVRHDLWIVTSAIAIVEVHKLGKTPGDDEESKTILRFFEHERIAVRPADRQTVEMAHELARSHGLACMDAIHVATALIAKVQVFYTYDGPKKGRKGLLKQNGKIGNPPLSIQQPPAKPVPPDPDKGTIFDPEKLAQNE
ncbi:MAG TPA: type II toxin-antitoxin system VapC family toxin [Gemmataceae bacterium]|nr:type II toxin-antitoxin system VapC family toxin [Gemmataceae bacterium]